MARHGLGSALLQDGSRGLGTAARSWRCPAGPRAARVLRSGAMHAVVPRPSQFQGWHEEGAVGSRGLRRGCLPAAGAPGSPAGPLGIWWGLGTAAGSVRRRKRAELAAGAKPSHGAQHHDQSHAMTQEMLSGAGLRGWAARRLCRGHRVLLGGGDREGNPQLRH